MAIITRKMSDSAVLPALRASSRNSIGSRSTILAKIDDGLKLEEPSPNADEHAEDGQSRPRTVYHCPEAVAAFKFTNCSGPVLDDDLSCHQLQMERTDMPPMWFDEPLHYLASQTSTIYDAAPRTSSSPSGNRRTQDDSIPHLCVSDMWRGLVASTLNPFDGVRDDSSCPFFQPPSF